VDYGYKDPLLGINEIVGGEREPLAPWLDGNAAKGVQRIRWRGELPDD